MDSTTSDSPQPPDHQRESRRAAVLARLDDAAVTAAVRTGVSPRAVAGVLLVALAVVAVLGVRVVLARSAARPAPVAPVRHGATAPTATLALAAASATADTAPTSSTLPGAAAVADPTASRRRARARRGAGAPAGRGPAAPGGAGAGRAGGRGGATRRADLAAVNLARPVVDGEQVVVPRPGDSTPPAASAARSGSAAGTSPVRRPGRRPRPSTSTPPRRAARRAARHRPGARRSYRPLPLAARPVHVASTSSVTSAASVTRCSSGCGRWCACERRLDVRLLVPALAAWGLVRPDLGLVAPTARTAVGVALLVVAGLAPGRGSGAPGGRHRARHALLARGAAASAAGPGGSGQRVGPRGVWRSRARALGRLRAGSRRAGRGRRRDRRSPPIRACCPGGRARCCCAWRRTVDGGGQRSLVRTRVLVLGRPLGVRALGGAGRGPLADWRQPARRTTCWQRSPLAGRPPSWRHASWPDRCAERVRAGLRRAVRSLPADAAGCSLARRR